MLQLEGLGTGSKQEVTGLMNELEKVISWYRKAEEGRPKLQSRVEAESHNHEQRQKWWPCNAASSR